MWVWANLKVLALWLCVSAAPIAQAQTFSTYGTPGLIELPTAEVMEDGQLTFSASKFGATSRNTVTFQIVPRLHGSFRYSIIDDFNGDLGDRFDRSFDLHYQILEERSGRPAFAIGLRDFVGTGVYSSEYLVATKTVAPGLKFSAGLGWGRLGQRGGFDNPLGIIDDRFETRPDRGGNVSGQLDTDAWFRGDIAPFGGVSWQVNERLTFKAEWSPDTYSEEARRGVQFVDDPWNFGMNYRFDNGIDLAAFVIGHDQVGLQFSYTFNPAMRRIPAGREGAAPALQPRNSVALASWNLPEREAITPDVLDVLRQRLAQQGIVLQGFELGQTEALIRVQNNRWAAEGQAAGRAARTMANTLPPQIETFRITFQENGVPITTLTSQRADLYDLEYDYDGAWRSLVRTDITDAAGLGRRAELADAFPRFEWDNGVFTRFSLFDPDDPVRYEFGPELFAAYRPSPGLTFSTVLSYPVVSTVDDATRQSNSVLQRVRSDGVLYAQQSDLEINHLTAEYIFRPGTDLFGRVTLGYLEAMYGGVSAELLWFPVESRLALGGELNYARQRDFDILFGFQDYDVLTGHLSAYYDFGNGFWGQVDTGRYLGGDWGATFNVTREFNNGFRVGGFFTLTDVPFGDFGEGSFDKGITLEIPVDWLTGNPSRRTISQVIRPVVRDGGARLNVRNRLYEVTRDYRADELGDSWGRYFK